MPLDIHFPISGFEMVSKLKHFNIIYPIEHYTAKTITIDHIVRAIAWDDDIYSALMNSREVPKEVLVPMAGAYYDISYIRDCSLRKVISSEWKGNWGPQNLHEWHEHMKEDSLDRFVRVIVFEKPSYSLKEFNRKYTNARAKRSKS